MLRTTGTSSYPFAGRSLTQHRDPSEGDLAREIAEAVCDSAAPISRLLRLMAALDASGADDLDLRRQLRARIGAPLYV